MLSTKEVPSQGKQIYNILAIIGVNDFLALCIDVEAQWEAFCTRCVWSLCFAYPLLLLLLLLWLLLRDRQIIWAGRLMDRLGFDVGWR